MCRHSAALTGRVCIPARLLQADVVRVPRRRLGAPYLVSRPEEQLAAAAARLPAHGAFSGRTSAWLHGLDLPPCDPIEATVRLRGGVSGRAGMALRRAVLHPGDVVERRGFKTLSLLRTLADLAQRRSLVEAVTAIDMALHQGLVGHEQLAAYVEANAGAKWAGRLRRAVSLADPRSESAMESCLRVLLVTSGLPHPEPQVAIRDGRGNHLGRVDLYYREQRLAIEYDGSTHRESLVADNRRQNALVQAGVKLLRFTYADVVGNPEHVIAIVAAAHRERTNAGTRRAQPVRAA